MSFNVDGLSLFYMLLTNILLVITMIIVFDDTYLTKVYCLALVAINILLNIVFTIRDLFGFYISFEALIIPMFIIIGV
jgi:NADH:ubiquinone oxidoreductase subunit 4 (subunit M)